MTADPPPAHKDQTARRPRKMTAERLHRIGLAYLERYEASEAGFRAMLSRRVLKAAQAHGQDPAAFADMIDAEVDRARRCGLVDNARFAANQVRRQRDRGASGRAITARLRAKGIDPSLTESALAEDERDDDAAARRYAQRRRLGPYRLRARAERRDRDLAAMCRAGFSLDTARAVIDVDREEEEEEGDGA